MNKKLLEKLSIPVAVFIISAVFSIVAKSVMHNEMLSMVFSLCMAASVVMLVLLMFNIMKSMRDDEARLVIKCQDYLQKNYGPGFKCSRALATAEGEDPKFPSGIVAGPLQIEGSFNGIPFRFRIVDVFERLMWEKKIRKQYIWHGTILEWGPGLSEKEYTEGTGSIDDFELEKTLSMIKRKLVSY
jgi:hypothetical protein